MTQEALRAIDAHQARLWSDIRREAKLDAVCACLPYVTVEPY